MVITFRKVCKIAGLLLLFCPSISIGQALAETNVGFRWDPNTEPDLAGYRIFRRPAGGQYDYTNPVVDISCGANDSSCAEGIDPAVPDGTYHWVVRAYDTEGYESEDSNEVTDTLNSTPPDNPSNLTIVEKEVIP